MPLRRDGWCHFSAGKSNQKLHLLAGEASTGGRFFYSFGIFEMLRFYKATNLVGYNAVYYGCAKTGSLLYLFESHHLFETRILHAIPR